MKAHYLLPLTLLVLVITACVSLETPKTPREMIAYGYKAIESAADTVRVAKRDGYITASERDDFVRELQQSLDDLNQARLLLTLFENSGDVDAESQMNVKLNRALSTLDVMARILEARQHE